MLQDELLNKGSASTQDIWKVARAATAANYFFDPMEIETDIETQVFTDGAIGNMNNPTRIGVAEIIGVTGRNDSIDTVVSIGTCRPALPLKKRLLSNIPRWIDRVGDPEPVHSEIEGLSEQLNFGYYRFNWPKERGFNMDFDEWKPSSWSLSSHFPGKGTGGNTKDTIFNHFNKWGNHLPNQEDLRRCARDLVETRRMRSNGETSSKWEHFATGARFPCDQCPERDPDFDRDHYEAHLRTEHGYDEEQIARERNRKVRMYTYKGNE